MNLYYIFEVIRYLFIKFNIIYNKDLTFSSSRVLNFNYHFQKKEWLII